MNVFQSSFYTYTFIQDNAIVLCITFYLKAPYIKNLKIITWVDLYKYSASTVGS